MAKATRSGIVIHPDDVPVILGMLARNDRKHDIAAWFGLNQGRIKDVENGDHGTPKRAPENKLPPSGSPGPRAKKLRIAAEKVEHLLKLGNVAEAKNTLAKAIQAFDKNQE